MVDIVTVGAGRVREQRTVDAAGDSLVTGDGGRALYDTSLAEHCWPELLADGSIRCVPRAVHLSSIPLYADDQCSHRVVGGYGDTCGGTTTPPSYVVEHESCGVASCVHALSDELDSEDVYWNLAGCSLAEPFIGTGTFFHIGEEVPLETFVELDYVVDGP